MCVAWAGVLKVHEVCVDSFSARTGKFRRCTIIRRILWRSPSLRKARDRTRVICDGARLRGREEFPFTRIIDESHTYLLIYLVDFCNRLFADCWWGIIESFQLFPTINQQFLLKTKTMRGSLREPRIVL